MRHGSPGGRERPGRRAKPGGGTTRQERSLAR